MKFKINTTLKHISSTIVAEITILLSFIFVYRILAHKLGPQAVGAYSLTKTVIALLVPFLILGFWVGIPRYLAISKDSKEGSSYLKSGIFAVFSFTFLFIIVANIFKDFSANIFFGDPKYTGLIFPFSLFLVGLMLYNINYAYFRGKMMIKTLNLSQIFTVAAPSLVVILFLRNSSVEQLITNIALTTLLVAVFFSTFFWKELFIMVDWNQLKTSFKNIFYFSISRAFGNFATIGILSLGPILATHVTNMVQVGYLSISQSLLGGISVFLSPMGTILLPKVSKHVGENDHKTIEENVDFLISAIFYVFIFVSIQAVIFSDIVITFWLGPIFISAVPVARIILAPMVFYAMFLALATVLDAVKTKPINTINSLISLSFFLVAFVLLLLLKIFTPIISLSVSYSSALILLGCLTYFSIRKIYPNGVKKDLNHLLSALLFSAILGVFSLSMKNFIENKFLYFIIFGIIVVMIYFLLLWFFQKEWVKQIFTKAVS